MWREYAHATAEYLRLQLDLYMAGTARDWAKESSLNELITSAQARRDDARDVVRRHELQKHNIAE
jgi:hypothetical protein